MRPPTFMSTHDWQQADAHHHLHPFTDFKALASKGTRVIERGENIYVWDSDGHRILDAMSGLWCVNVGYGRTELIDAATQQLQKLPFYNSFFQTTTPAAIELAQRLSELAPAGFSHVFYSSSGSESNDTIIRMVRRFWDLQGQTQRHVIISRRNAYHGSTMAAASLGGMPGMHAQGGLPIPDIDHIDQPFALEHAQPGESPENFGLRAAGWLEAKILKIGPERVAAFIGEPVQGAGGVIVPPCNYWPEIQRICRQYHILLISDEVICGFGRTGQWWGCQTWGFEPDLMTFAKGVTSGYIPLGGVLVGQRVAEVLIEQGGEFSHGYTYSGHPVACAVALANIQLLQKEAWVDCVREKTGPYLAQRYQALAQHPLVGQAQTCGLMGALQLVKNKQPLETFNKNLQVGMLCRAHCFEQGIIMRAVGDRMIIAPPLIITESQIDEMVELITRCLDLTLAELQQKGWL